MTSREQLESLGFEVSFTQASQVVAWGKWFVGLKKSSGHAVNGYGVDEEAAFADALATVNKPIEISSTNQRGH